MMRSDDNVSVWLPPEEAAAEPRVCRMSVELYQNAQQTMGELRDMMREMKVSWDFLQQQIEAARHDASPVEKALRQMDSYSTGMGKSLGELGKNVW